MTKSAARLFCTCAVVLGLQLLADDTATRPQLTVKDLALLSEAVVVARVGMVSAAPAADGGAAALWIERSLKGRLRGGRDIIWVPRKELPKAEPGAARWLLFLARHADGSWHVQNGGRDENLVKLDASNAALVNDIAKLTGASGAGAEPETPAEAEVGQWIKQAGTGSRNTRRDSFSKLLAAGDGARPQLLTAVSSSDREIANVARTLAALTGGGPEVNGLRLILEPANLALKTGAKRVLTVQLANLTDRDIRVVTGQGAWGETVQASAAYQVRVQCPMTGCESGGKCASGCRAAIQPPLPTVLPKAYGVPGEGGGPPLPLIRVVPGYGTLPLAVDVELETVQAGGKDVRRLKFPHGYIVLEGAEKFSVRVRFDCPGPRVDQPRLIEANYWGGGQLVSNDITLSVK